MSLTGRSPEQHAASARRSYVSSRARAFGTIDVAVAVGALMILAALIYPALVRTQYDAATTRAIASMRGVASTVDAYTREHRDVYPIGAGSLNGNAYGWVTVVGGAEAVDPDGVRALGSPSIRMARGLFDDAALMVPTKTQNPGMPCTPVTTGQVEFPAQKGAFVQFLVHYQSASASDPLPVVPSQRHRPPAWCCVSGVAAPVLFADGSVDVGGWPQFSKAGFVILSENGFPVLENEVGIPVLSSWHGAKSRDR